MGQVGEHNFGQLIDTLRPSRFPSRELLEFQLAFRRGRPNSVRWHPLVDTAPKPLLTNGSTPLTMSDILQLTSKVFPMRKYKMKTGKKNLLYMKICRVCI